MVSRPDYCRTVAKAYACIALAGFGHQANFSKQCLPLYISDVAAGNLDFAVAASLDPMIRDGSVRVCERDYPSM